MNKTSNIILLLFLCFFNLASCSQKKQGLKIVKSFFSAQIKSDWKYKVYLPAGYHDNKEFKYPVVYLLHGSDGDEHDWDFIYPILDSLIVSKDIPPMISVSPSTGTSWWVNSESIPYESAFFQDLIPEIDNNFRTISKKEARGIVGFSMGGYGTLRYALGYPHYFGSAMILSAAIYDNLPPEGSSARTSGAFGIPFNEKTWNDRNYPSSLQYYLKNELQVPLFIATGDDDWNHEEGFEYNVEQQAVLLYGKLHKEGGSPAELRIINGGHTKDVWSRAFIEGIQYMFQYLHY